MPRPIKCRRVGFVPKVTFFKPTGIPMRFLEVISLSMEELEAIRLKDQLGLQQEECAESMGISRPTFHRVLASARAKIADALISAKAIRIEGGDFELAGRRFRCGWDGYEWDVPREEINNENTPECPKCKRTDVESLDQLQNQNHPGKGRHRRGFGR